MASFRFIKPSEPVDSSLPPEGDGWEIECKWDGYRAQLHKQGDQVFIYSRNGKYMSRFKNMYEPLRRLPARSAIIDAEIVALNAKGLPDFRALHGGQHHSIVCVCFDLLELNGKDLQQDPLKKRRASLRRLLEKADIPELPFSESHTDGEQLLKRLNKIGMEGVDFKRKEQKYVSGRNRGWVKVKCHAWYHANANRKALFSHHNRSKPELKARRLEVHETRRRLFR